MENRNVRDQEEELKNEDFVVVDECEDEEMKSEEPKEASDAPSAQAGIGLFDFLLKFNKYR